MSKEPPDPSEFRKALDGANHGDPNARDRLYDLAYVQLREMARSCIRNGRNPSLQSADLVNELYLRLFGHTPPWRGPDHFFAVTFLTMRNILRDRARRRTAQKREGGRKRVEWDSALVLIEEDPVQFLSLDRALERLEAEDRQTAEVVRCHFYLGFSWEETAKATDLSVSTVYRRWEYARAWLHRELSEGDRTGLTVDPPARRDSSSSVSAARE